MGAPLHSGIFLKGPHSKMTPSTTKCWWLFFFWSSAHTVEADFPMLVTPCIPKEVPRCMHFDTGLFANGRMQAEFWRLLLSIQSIKNVFWTDGKCHNSIFDFWPRHCVYMMHLHALIFMAPLQSKTDVITVELWMILVCIPYIKIKYSTSNAKKCFFDFWSQLCARKTHLVALIMLARK